VTLLLTPELHVEKVFTAENRQALREKVQQLQNVSD